MRALFDGETMLSLAQRLNLDPSVVHRDWHGARPISDERLAMYCDALPSWTQKRQLLAAWVADCLPEHLRAAVKIESPDVAMVREDSEDVPMDLDLLAVDAKLRAAIASLIGITNDQNVRGWIIDTASILAPLAVPDQRKTGKKRHRYGKQ